MKLVGRYAPPPPPLPAAAEKVSSALASWPDVHARTHWQLGNEHRVDGADFYLGGEELGHLHLHGEAHVATGLPVCGREARADGDEPLWVPFASPLAGRWMVSVFQSRLCNLCSCGALNHERDDDW